MKNIFIILCCIIGIYFIFLSSSNTKENYSAIADTTPYNNWKESSDGLVENTVQDSTDNTYLSIDKYTGNIWKKDSTKKTSIFTNLQCPLINTGDVRDIFTGKVVGKLTAGFITYNTTPVPTAMITTPRRSIKATPPPATSKPTSSGDPVDNYINQYVKSSLYARFKAIDYTGIIDNGKKIWRDKTFNRTSSSVYITIFDSTGLSGITTVGTSDATSSFPAVRGTSSSRMDITNAAIPNYTLFHVASYRNNNQYRIFDGKTDNWLSGFHGGKAGVAHYNNWIGSSSTGSVNTTDWVISVSYADSSTAYYRANGKIYTNNSGTIKYLPPLTINNGVYKDSESSDFKVADIIIFKTRLSDDQINNIQSLLGTFYGIRIEGATTPAPTTTAAVTTAASTTTAAVTTPAVTTPNCSLSGINVTAYYTNRTGTVVNTASNGAYYYLIFKYISGTGDTEAEFTANQSITAYYGIVGNGGFGLLMPGYAGSKKNGNIIITANTRYKIKISAINDSSKSSGNNIILDDNNNQISAASSGMNGNGSYDNAQIPNIVIGENPGVFIYDNGVSKFGYGGFSNNQRGNTGVAIIAFSCGTQFNTPFGPTVAATTTPYATTTAPYITTPASSNSSSNPTFYGLPITGTAIRIYKNAQETMGYYDLLNLTNGTTGRFTMISIRSITTGKTYTGTIIEAGINYYNANNWNFDGADLFGYMDRSDVTRNIVTLSSLDATLSTATTTPYATTTAPYITTPARTPARTVDAIETYINSNSLTPNIYARFKASDYDSGGTWNDKAYNKNNAIVDGYISKYSYGGGSNGASKTFTTLIGVPATKITFTTATINNNGYTLFHVARYNRVDEDSIDRSSKLRIFDGTGTNWLSGFWNGKPGVAFYNDWVGGTDYGPNPSPLSSVPNFQTNWVISVSYADTSTSYYRCNGKSFSSNGLNKYLPPLSINNGKQKDTESSDFELADVIIFNTRLSDTQIVDIEGRLATMYGIRIMDAIESYINSNSLTSNLHARFKASDYDSGTTWSDKAYGKNNAVISNPSFLAKPTVTNGSKIFQVLQGTNSASIQLVSNTINSSYTLFHVTRYNGPNKNEIISNVGSNWVSGFQGGKAGVAYNNNSAINNNGLSDNTQWVISVNYTNTYDTCYYRANGRQYSFYNDNSELFLPSMGINMNGGIFNSEFQIADVIIFNTRLSDTQIVDIEGRLATMYGITLSS